MADRDPDAHSRASVPAPDDDASVGGPPAPPVPTRQLSRVAGKLVPLTMGVQLLSFAASAALAAVLGATYETDAYYLAFSFPLVVLGILLATVRLGSIPALIDIDLSRPADLEERSSELTSAVMRLSLVLTLLATGLALLLLPMLLSDVDARAVPLARLLVVELAPLTVLTAAMGVFGAILSVRSQFAWPAAVMGFDPLLRFGCVLALGDHLGVHALVVGHLIGNVVAAAVLWWLVRRSGLRLRLRARPNTPFVRRIFIFSGPLLIGQSVLTLNPFVDRVMSSTLGAGRVTELELGLRVFNVPVALLGSALVAPVMAIWGARYSKEGWSALRSSASRALLVALSVLPPVVALGFLLRHELITALYKGGAFSSTAADSTASVFGLLVLGMPGMIVIQIYGTLFLVRKNSIVPMAIAFANIVLNVVLNFAFRPQLGVAGIALSTSVTLTLLAVLYAFLARRKFGPLLTKRPGLPLMRAMAATATVAALGVWLLDALPPANSRLSALLVVGLLTLVGGVTQLAVLRLSGDPLGIALMKRLRGSLTVR